MEEDVPALQSGQVLVELKAVGICGSDVHYFLEGGLGSFKEKLPMSMGHEPAGMIVDANGSKLFKTGDRVAIDPARPCLRCQYCLRGLHNLCRDGTFLGAQGSPGGFREYLVVSEQQLVKIDDSVSYEEGALLEVMGIAYHALSLTEFQFFSTVAIFGAGPIGLSVLKLAKKRGAGKTFIVDKLDYRLEFALSYGADHALKESDEVIGFAKDQTDGLGVDMAIDAAGMQNTVHNCFKIVAPKGKIILIGIPTYDYLEYNPHAARIKELSIFNVRRSNQTLHLCRNMLKGQSILSMVTHRFKLDDIQEAFETVAGYRDGVIKAMIVF